MSKSRWFFIALLVLALGAGIFACGGSDDSSIPCAIDQADAELMIWGNWIIMPSTYDPVGHYVSLSSTEVLDHSFMFNSPHGTVTFTGCSSFALAIQNATADEFEVTGWLDSGTQGKITSIDGVSVNADLRKGELIPLGLNTSFTASGTLTETCVGGAFANVCDGTVHDLSLAGFSEAVSSGSITNTNGPDSTTFSVNGTSVGLRAGTDIYYFFLRTDAPDPGNYSPYRMVRLSSDISNGTGQYGAFIKPDGIVGDVNISSVTQSP